MTLSLLSLFWGCEQAALDIPHSLHREIVLDGGWSLAPWRMHRPRLRSINSQITLDEHMLNDEQHVELELSSVWWKGKLQTSDQTHEFTGGIPPVSIDLTNSLSEPTERLSLNIEGPSKVSSLKLGGSLRSNQTDLSRARWLTPPKLLILPKDHISSVSLIHEDSGVSFKLWLTGAVRGSAQIQVFEDAEKIEELSFELKNNAIQSEPIRWDHPLWSLGAPKLYTIVATWYDDQGVVLDRHRFQSAPRSVTYSSQSLNINAQTTPLMGARLVIPDNPEDWYKQLDSILSSNINFLEIHGAVIPDSLLTWADRTGMGIVVVPRCIGRSNANPLTFPDKEQIMTNQDERLLKQLRGHPSFLFFVLEGVDAGLLLYSQALRQSEFLLGGLDFPSGRLHIDVKNKKATCLPHNDCSAVWITEVTMRSMRQNTSWDQVLNIQNKALSRAPLGMVIPRPKNQNWASWQDKYRSLAQSWSVANRSIRPPVPVVVEGAPLETVWHTPEEGKGVLINPSGTYTILK